MTVPEAHTTIHGEGEEMYRRTLVLLAVVLLSVSPEALAQSSDAGGNLLMKNLMACSRASLAFLAVGYAVMWG